MAEKRTANTGGIIRDGVIAESDRKREEKEKNAKS
jgi:hypothetical protein